MGFLRNLLLQIKFLIFVNTSGLGNNPQPVDMLAFQTVAVAKYLKKPWPLNRDALATYDLILYMMYVLRLECMSKINSTKKADEFSKAYVHKVLKYCKNKEKLNRKYSRDIFRERTNIYNSLFDSKASLEKNKENISLVIDDIVYFNTYNKGFFSYDNYKIGWSQPDTSAILADREAGIFVCYADNHVDAQIWVSSFTDYFYKAISDVVEQFKETPRGRTIYDSDIF